MRYRQNHLKWSEDFFGSAFLGSFRVLYFLIDQPGVLFSVAILAFMFRPPDLKVLPFDRIAFVLLVLLVALTGLTRRRVLSINAPIMLPMLVLAIIAICNAFRGLYNVQTWSNLANTYIVPFTMFFVSREVFRNDRAIRYFFLFSTIVLAYLIFISIAFMLNVKFLIFPRYILSLVPADLAHSSRACGPFLNPVANGTAIIMLGLVSLHWFLKMKSGLPRILLFVVLAALPFALLATMTRGVWLSFLFAVIFFFVSTKYPVIRKTGIIWIMLAIIGIFVATNSTTIPGFMSERISDQQNIDFRFNLYRAAFEMFTEKPIFGWGANVSPFVINRYLPHYQDDVSLHNTYLDVLVGLGLLGFIFYAILIVGLFSSGKSICRSDFKQDESMIDREFVFMFRNILSIYLVNSLFVVMLYQFPNALVFSIAGIISAREAYLAESSMAGQ